jgi:hypothetical protein
VPIAFYVYYRVDPVAASSARARVRQLFERLEQRCGVRGRLLAKRGDSHLWMEVYEDTGDPARFESAMRAEVVALNLDAILLAGHERRLECFEE